MLCEPLPLPLLMRCTTIAIFTLGLCRSNGLIIINLVTKINRIFGEISADLYGKVAKIVILPLNFYRRSKACIYVTSFLCKNCMNQSSEIKENSYRYFLPFIFHYKIRKSAYLMISYKFI